MVAYNEIINNLDKILKESSDFLQVPKDNIKRNLVIESNVTPFISVIHFPSGLNESEQIMATMDINIYFSTVPDSTIETTQDNTMNLHARIMQTLRNNRIRFDYLGSEWFTFLDEDVPLDNPMMCIKLKTFFNPYIEA